MKKTRQQYLNDARVAYGTAIFYLGSALEHMGHVSSGPGPIPDADLDGLSMKNGLACDHLKWALEELRWGRKQLKKAQEAKD